MAQTVDQVIGGIVKALYDAEAAGWSIQDKAVLLAAVQQSLIPAKGNFPKKEGEEPGKEKA